MPIGCAGACGAELHGRMAFWAIKHGSTPRKMTLGAGAGSRPELAQAPIPMAFIQASAACCPGSTSPALADDGGSRPPTARRRSRRAPPRELACDRSALAFMMAPFPSWLTRQVNATKGGWVTPHGRGWGLGSHCPRRLCLTADAALTGMKTVIQALADYRLSTEYLLNARPAEVRRGSAETFDGNREGHPMRFSVGRFAPAGVYSFPDRCRTMCQRSRRNHSDLDSGFPLKKFISEVDFSSFAAHREANGIPPELSSLVTDAYTNWA